MSKKIDEQVVSMRFDNRHFEQNVAQTMSTLDKLKAKLSFKKTSNEFDNLSKSAKKVNLSPLADSVETVRTKFSALEVMGVTALANITNSAVNAGKRIVAALTIDPVKTGYQEYVTQLNATQTILSNVKHKGKDINDVNAALDELNTYADKTIYNFTEMTRNIGLFVNAGVDLDKSVSAIKGFSNAAAMSGADATTTARAMYQLSQGMSSGAIKLMDWKSLETANITGERFRDVIKMTAKVHGINVDAMEKKEGSFRETLKSGWLSADLMSEALDHYTLSLEDMTEAEIAARKEQLKSKGYTEEQIKQLFELGTEASNAATKVKSFSQMFDVLKEAAQSGWSKTWRLIFGDLEQAKAVFTPLTNFFQNIIDGMSNFRNRMLEALLGSPIGQLAEKISKISTVSMDAAGKMKDLGDIVDRVIRGEFGNMEPRWQKLTELGYDWAHVQNLVNEKLGNSYRRATTYKEGQEELTQATMELTDAQLKELGFTDAEIKAYRELEKESKRTGKSIQEIVNGMDNMTGRERIIKSLAKMGNALRDAWREIFPPRTEEQINKMAEALSKFSTKLLMSDETADKLRRTFRGLFAALDIVLTVVGGPIKIAFKILTQMLGMCDIPVLSLTASLGDLIVKFRDFIDGIFDCAKIAEMLIPTLKGIVGGIKDWIVGIKDAKNIPKYIIEGLINGLKNGASGVISAITYVAEVIIDTFKKILGIHSPSVVFITLGGFLIAGLVAGLTGGMGNVLDVMKTIGSNLFDIVKTIFSKIIDFVKNLDLGKVFAIAVAGSIFLTVKKLMDILGMFGKAADSFGNLMDSTAGVMDAFRDRIKPNKFKQTTESIRNLAIAIGILAASVWLLTKVKPTDLWIAVGAIAALAAIVGVLVFAIGKMDLKGDNLGKLSGLLLSLSATLYITASAIKKLSFLNEDNVLPVVAGVYAMITGLVLIMLAIGKLVDCKGSANIEKASILVRKIATTMLLLALTIKLISKLDGDALTKGIGVMLIFGGFVVGLIAATKLAGTQIDSAGVTIKKIAAAMLLLTLAIKLISWLDPNELKTGIAAISIFTLLITGLMAATKLLSGKGKSIQNSGKMILGVGAAMLLMALSVKICASMNPEDMNTGLACITMFGLLAVGLVAVVSKVKGKVKGVASTLIAMSAAVMIMSASAVILSLLDVGGLIKGVAAVSIFGILVSNMAKSLNGAKDAHKAIKAMSITIGVMAASLLILSLIPPAKLASATLALSAITGMFILLVRSLQTIKTGEKTFKRTLITLGMLTAVVGMLAFVIGALTTVKNPEALIPAATSIGILLLALSTSFSMLDSKNTKKGAGLGEMTKKLGVMAVVIVALAGVMAVLSNITNPEPLIPLATAVTILMGALTGTLAAMTGLSKISGSNDLNKLLPTLATLGVIMAALTVVLAAMSTVANPEPLIPLMNAVAKAMIVLTGVTAAVALLGKVCGPGALGAAQPIILLMIEIVGVFGLLAAALGLLLEYVPNLNKFINQGVSVLVAVAEGMGKVIGAFAAGIAEGAALALPKIGESLAGFMDNAQPFFEGLDKLDGNTLAGIGVLTGAILAITAASLINGIVSFLSFGQSSIEAFGKDLAKLGFGVANFSLAVANISADKVKMGAQAIADIANATHKIPTSGGLLGVIMGGKNISKFAMNLPLLGAGIANFSRQAISVVPTIVKAAAQAVADVANATHKIPTSGGLMGLLMGGKDISKFSMNLPLLGAGIANFSVAVGDVSPEKVNAASGAIANVANALHNLPTTGGFMGWLMGDQDISEFSRNLPFLGAGIANFSTAVNTVNPDKVESAAEAAKHIAQMTQYIPNNSGLKAWFGGSDSVFQFALNLGPLGEGLKAFGKAVKGIPGDDMEAAATAATAIVEMTRHIPQQAGLTAWITGKDSIAEFAGVFPTLGEGLKDFSDKLEGINPENIKAGAKAASAIAELCAVAPPSKDGVKGWLSVGESGDLEAFGATFADIGGGIKAFANALGTDDYNVEDMKSATEAFKTILDSFGELAGKMEEITSLDVMRKNNGLDTFSEMVNTLLLGSDGKEGILVSAGKGMREFGNTIADVNVDSEKVTSFASGFAEIASAVGAFKDVTGEDLTGIQTRISEFGTVISNFYNGTTGVGAVSEESIKKISSIKKQFKNWIAEVDPEKLDAVKEAVGKMKKAITDLSKIEEGDADGFEEAAKAIKDGFAELQKIDDGDTEIFDKTDKIKDFISILDTSIDSGNASKIGTAMTDIVDAINNASSIDETSTNGLVAAINNLKTSLNESSIEKALSSAKTAMTTAGKGLVDALKTGISDTAKLEEAKKAARALAAACGRCISNSHKLVGPAWEAAGKFCIEGLANGLKNNVELAKEAARSVADDMLTAARAEMGVESPSKEFIGIGRYCILGLAKGLLKNSSTSEDASVAVADNLLKAFQEELEIHSPSLVMNKQGHYVVQGIADGIKECKTAEEQAEKKAQNIIQAFQRVFDTFDARINFNNVSGELQKAILGAFASPVDESNIDRQTRKKNVKILEEAAKVAQDEFDNAAKTFKPGTKEYIEAESKLKEAKKAVQDAYNEINEGEYDHIMLEDKEKVSEQEWLLEHRQIVEDRWLKEYGKTLDDYQLIDRQIKKLTEDQPNLDAIVDIKADTHSRLLAYADAMWGGYQNAPEAYQDLIDEAWKAVQEAMTNADTNRDQITDLLIQRESLDVSRLEEAQEKADKDFEHYMELNGDKLSEDKKDELYKKYYNEKIRRNKERLKEKEEVYKKVLEDEGEHSKNAEEIAEEIDEIRRENELTEKAILDIDEEAKDRKFDEAKEKNDIAASRADLEYSIWEATTGRKASTAEKNVAKLSNLSKQVTIQSSALQLAYREWQEAASEYGRSSNEAQAAYNDYLNEQLDLAKLQNEILEIEEETVERQKLAKSDYNDYMKTYAKYYELNGMSYEQLKKDAKLVSGYDPNATVNSIFDSTKNALENVKESSKYAELMEGFSNIGSSYVGSVNQGVTDTTHLVEETIMSMLEACFTGMKSEDIKKKWYETGEFAVAGFVEGIRDNIERAAAAAARMAREALEAAEAELDINSPSRAFAEIGMYAVKGLVKGFDDNAYLSNNAATKLADSAINNLKATISRIYDTVDSELDTQPTIRPVLDLSGVESKAAKLNAMMSRDLAMGISARMSGRNNETNQNGVGNSETTNQYNFTQNNYSPKALSRSEIYRQTKNQFAALKGAMG